MARVKLYKVVPDSPIGTATINQAADNAAELRTQMLVGHGDHEEWLSVRGDGPLDYNAIGRHNLDEIPRSVGYGLLYLQTLLTNGVTMGWPGYGIPYAWKAGIGDYLLPVLGLSKFWAKVSAVGGTSVTYMEPRVRPFAATVANGNNAGLRVNTFALSGGDFVPLDMSFGIALYGTP